MYTAYVNPHRVQRCRIYRRKVCNTSANQIAPQGESILNGFINTSANASARKFQCKNKGIQFTV